MRLEADRYLGMRLVCFSTLVRGLAATECPSDDWVETVSAIMGVFPIICETNAGLAHISAHIQGATVRLLGPFCLAAGTATCLSISPASVAYR